MKHSKYIIKGITILMLVFNSLQLIAQIGTLDYKLSSENLSVAGQQVMILSTIEKAGDTIVWTQHNNILETSTFTITNTSGNWDAVTSVGIITYQMTMEDMPCELVLSGDGTNLSAILKVFTSNTDEYLFNINAITY